MSGIYYVFTFHPHEKGVHRRLTGKFALDEEGNVRVLEDHAGLLHGMEHTDSDKVARKLQRLNDSMHTEIVSVDDITAGHRPDLIESVQQPEESDHSNNPTVYEYHRVGLEHPQQLKFQDGEASLDDYKLSDVELARMLENVRAQKASIKKLDDNIEAEDKMKKFEEMYASLAKADPKLAEALGHVRQSVKSGDIHPDVLRTLTNHIFKDTLVPSMGNRKSFEDFQSRPRKGAHVSIDLNDFAAINKVHGQHVGDQAIKTAGTAIRNALDESVGRANGKAWHVSGDEFALHVPSHQHAAGFIRALKRHFDKIPPIGGTHSLSASVGVGESPEISNHALIQAKTAKKSAGYTSGQAKTHSYSAMPGFEGHLATE